MDQTQDNFRFTPRPLDADACGATSRLARFRLVLVSPMYGGNVGACARVAANYDLRDFRLVSPLCDWNGREARLFGKGPATEVLHRAEVAQDLRAALGDCQVAVGFTRRTGEKRQPTVALRELVGFGARGRVALIFGREDGGLSSEELSHCTHLCSLPVAELMPSLNLSHAVAVVLSRLYEDLSAESLHAGESLDGERAAMPSLADLEALIDHLKQTAMDLSLTRGGNPERLISHLRAMFFRASPRAGEIAAFRAFLSKVQVGLGTRRRR